MYQIVKIPFGRDYVQRLSDCAWIPMDESNSDYLLYLDWVSAGNVAPIINAEDNLCL